jgi:hypothetical protein
VQRLHDGLDTTTFDLLSPRELSRRSTLVFLSHKDRARNQVLHTRLRERGIEVACRRGALRREPHLDNTPDDIDRALAFMPG